MTAKNTHGEYLWDRNAKMFDCGDTIAYEMRNDENAMWQAAKFLIEFIDYKGEDFFKTFGDQSIIFARDLLIDRLEKYPSPNSISGGLQPDSVTGINQVSEPERVDFPICPCCGL